MVSPARPSSPAERLRPAGTGAEAGVGVAPPAVPAPRWRAPASGISGTPSPPPASCPRGQLAGFRFPRTAGVDECHFPALVVGGAPRADHRHVVPRIEAGVGQILRPQPCGVGDIGAKGRIGGGGGHAQRGAPAWRHGHGRHPPGQGWHRGDMQAAVERQVGRILAGRAGGAPGPFHKEACQQAAPDKTTRFLVISRDFPSTGGLA